MRQLPPARGLQGFFRSTSCNMCLSRVRSATNPFNRRFSSSSCLSRLSSLTPIPAYLFFPTIQSSFADPELPAHFQPFGPSFDLFKRVDNPLLAVSFPWHFLSFLREPPTIRKLKFPPSSFGIQGQKAIHRFVSHTPLIADLHPQRVEIDHRIAALQRPILPLDHRFQHRIGHCADEVRSPPPCSDRAQSPRFDSLCSP